MTVYVDDMQVQADVPNGRSVVRGRWSHLTADTDEELHAFARRLGMRPEWAQYPGTPMSHYDVVQRKRAEAIRLGAVEITWRQAAQQLEAKREGRPWAPEPEPPPGLEGAQSLFG